MLHHVAWIEGLLITAPVLDEAVDAKGDTKDGECEDAEVNHHQFLSGHRFCPA